MSNAEVSDTRHHVIRGRNLHYRVSGRGAPVLLLHGIGRSLNDWVEQHERLSRDHRVYSVDLPGFGGSDRLPAPYTLAALAGSMWEFLDDMRDFGPVAIVGNSLGGAVALEMSVQQPARTRALVLANSAGFGKTVTVVLRLLALPGARVLLRPSRVAARREEQSVFYDQSFVTEERIAHTLAVAGRPGRAEPFLELARALGTWRGVSAGWRTELLARAAAHRRPTLVVWGDKDRILPVAHLDSVAGSLPHATTHVFAKTGHMPQIERADEFHQLTLEFLQAHPYPDPPGNA